MLVDEGKKRATFLEAIGVFIKRVDHAWQTGDAQDGDRAGYIACGVEHKIDGACAQRGKLFIGFQQFAAVVIVDRYRIRGIQPLYKACRAVRQSFITWRQVGHAGHLCLCKGSPCAQAKCEACAKQGGARLQKFSTVGGHGALLQC